MVEGAGSPGLADEAGEALRVCGELRRENLEGDIAAEQGIGGKVDMTHAADPNLRADFVRPRRVPVGKAM